VVYALARIGIWITQEIIQGKADNKSARCNHWIVVEHTSGIVLDASGGGHFASQCDRGSPSDSLSEICDLNIPSGYLPQDPSVFFNDCHKTQGLRHLAKADDIIILQ
jgi:hypothetical protein